MKHSIPSNLTISGADNLSLLASESEESDLKRFSMTAYTGGPIRLGGWAHPVVVDLEGLKVSKQPRPILKDHQTNEIVGHTESISVTDGKLAVEGVISGVGSSAQEVIATSQNGFPWQASLGASADRVIFVREGKTAQANGRVVPGPSYVVRRSTLGEVSFVALGADDNTSARVAASVDEDTMNFEQWADENGFDLETLDDVNTKTLRAMYTEDTQPDDPESCPSEQQVEAETTDAVQELRSAIAQEKRRIAAIQKLCNNDQTEIEAQAIEEGWDEAKTELAVLRASRPSAPAVTTSTSVTDSRILEAATCLSCGIAENEVTRQYGERVIESAYSMRHIGLRELVAECARLEGHIIPRVFGDGKETIRAGFSTMSLPGILENVMNKTLLSAYEATPIAAFDLCAVGSVGDFKAVSRYRLFGTGGFEPVTPDGELKHGKLSEDHFTNKADTYGQILMLTRHDIINDDLSAFMDIPRQMGRSGAESIDHLFFEMLLSNNNNFFGSGNNNYLTGADTKFGPDSLTEAKTLFRKQKSGPGTASKDQRPISVRPEILVVPVELETEAELLMGASQLMIDSVGTKTKIPTDNPHRNKYRVISTPHLSDSYYTGSSGKAWYLFANPKIIPAMEIVFLNGRRTPVIERIDSPPNVLGMGFRGYIDFGVNTQDPRAAVKIKGET